MQHSSVRLACWLCALLALWGMLACAYTPLGAGEFNEVLSIGDLAPAWKDLPGTDGQTHSLTDLADRKVLVVVFTCASCPTAVDYEERIDALAKKYGADSKEVAVVPICVNQVPEDRLPALTERVQSHGYSFSILYDESQKVARDFGAIFTPEFYVFGTDRKLVYMGAVDDNTDAAQATRNYVQEAITAVLDGREPEVKETIARGCRVRYARERRRPATGTR